MEIAVSSAPRAQRSRNLGRCTMAALLVLATLFGSASTLGAQQPSGKAPSPVASASTPQPDLPAKGQRTFDSAQAAVSALVAALQQNDSAALAKILGPDADKLLSSGDPTEDAQNRRQFLDKYAQMHRLVTEGRGLTTVYVGAENWPAPLPIAHRGYLWYFDTPAGEDQILYRRVGENELTVIQVCEQLVAAEKEYDAQPRQGSPVRQYAQRMLSGSGKQDGLYWPAAAGAGESPLGPLLASAEAEGYAQDTSPRRTPFYGYYFRILKAQGPNAPGGAKSYLTGGSMTRGFAFLAYPAEYRSSGVMTFIVGPDGVVFQKDLGPHTEQLAKSIAAYNPDATWSKADQPEKSAK
ncbi:MAG: DUF2950 domain-containing protein [Acidobacteriota bacterium]